MDIFSFRVLLMEMCTAYFPEVADHKRLIRSIQQPDMVALIRQCLAEDRDARPSASDIMNPQLKFPVLARSKKWKQILQWPLENDTQYIMG